MRFAVLVAVLAGCAGERAVLQKARAVVASAQPRSGDLRLTCQPEDAEVYLDGVGQGQCRDFAGAPRGLRVGTGLHRIEVKKRGYLPYQTYYEPSGATASLAPTLQPVGSEGESR